VGIYIVVLLVNAKSMMRQFLKKKKKKTDTQEASELWEIFEIFLGEGEVVKEIITELQQATARTIQKSDRYQSSTPE